MLSFQLMQYFNLFRAKRGAQYWATFSEDQRLTIGWAIITAVASAVFWLSQRVIPENPTVFRYFISLYVINSLVFFLILKDYKALARTMLVFLICLELVVSIYYGLNYLSLGVE